jgi:hypothetical protein
MMFIHCTYQVIAFATVVVFASTAFAQVQVRSHTRNAGTFVMAHQPSGLGGNFWNNNIRIGNHPHPAQPIVKRTPPRVHGGVSLSSLARSGFSRPANSLMPGCHESRAHMLTSANRSPSYCNRSPASCLGESYIGESSSDSTYASVLSRSEREHQRELQLAQQRRDEEQSRREKVRMSIPVRTWSEEELAASRFKVAHLLYLDGNIDASKNVLTRLLDEYPDTVTADRAKLALARL